MVVLSAAAATLRIRVVDDDEDDDNDDGIRSCRSDPFGAAVLVVSPTQKRVCYIVVVVAVRSAAPRAVACIHNIECIIRRRSAAADDDNDDGESFFAVVQREGRAGEFFDLVCFRKAI
jgi:hypothetical protein